MWGQTQQPQQNYSAFGGTTGGGNYGNQSSSFTSGFAQQSQFQGGAQGSMQKFGSSAGNTSFSQATGGSSMTQQQQAPSIPQFYKTGQFDQTICTIEVPFYPKSENTGDKNKSSGQDIVRHFNNIRIEPKYSVCSGQMLKLLDMMAMSKRAPQTSYEYIAGGEFQQNQQAYPLLNKMLGGIQVGSTPQQTLQPQLQQTSWGAPQTQTSTFGQKPGFGGTSSFGQQPSTPFGSQPTAPMFGGQQTGQFGSAQSSFGQPQQSSFGQKPLFSGGASQPTGSVFGGNQSGIKPAFGAAQNTGFQQVQTGTGFGAGQQQTPMFGGAQQQQASPMFGGAQAQPMFGSMQMGQQQQTQQSSLFGQNQTPGFGGAAAPGGSLFGGSNGGLALGASGQQIGQAANVAQPISGGLFGGGGTQNTGLFGPKPAQPAGGLFGATSLGTGQSQQSSLFGGQKQPSSGGIFGNPPLNGAPTLQPQTSSLFGPQGSSLFGAQQTQLGGLSQPMFSISQQQPAPGPQPIQIMNPYTDLTKLADPYGNKALFLDEKTPYDNAEDELKRLQEEIYNGKTAFRDDPYKEITPLDKMRKGYSNLESSNIGQEYLTPQILETPQLMPNEEENQRAMHDKLASKFKQQIEKRINAQHADNKEVYMAGRGFVQQKTVYKPQKTFGTDSSFALSRQQSISSSKDEGLYKNEKREPSYAQKDVTERPNNDILKIEVSIPSDNGYDQYFAYIHKTRDMSDLYNKVTRIVKEQGKWTNDIKDIKILYKNSIVSKDISLKQAGLIESPKVTIVYEKFDIQSPIEEEPVKQRQAPFPKKVVSENVPKKPKIGYRTQPEFSEIAKMSTEELKNVSNFTITNEHGSIEFLGETDLTDVDLEDIITIEEGGVEVYDETRHRPYPKRGEKLNKPAKITLFNIELPNDMTYKQFIQALEQSAREQDVKYIGSYQFQGKHLQYDQKKQQWHFEVSHFTRYKFQKPVAQQQKSVTDIQIQEDESVFVEQQPLAQELLQITNQNNNNTIRNERPTKMLRKNPEFVDENMSEIQSRQDDQIVIESQSRIFPKPITVSSITQQRADYFKLKKIEIEQNIQRREREWSETSGIFGQKPSLSECMNYLKGLKVEVNDQNLLLKNQPLKGIVRCRPQFKPDGKLLTVINGNKLQIKEINIVKGSSNAEQNKIYNGISDVLMQHTQIEEIADEKEATEKLQNFHIDPEANQINEQKRGLLGLLNEQLEDYDDRSIQFALQKAYFPIVSFKEDPKDHFYFYESIAKYILKEISRNPSASGKEKLQQEFFVICTMNALFGNPNILLHQLHPSFKGGLNNYDKMRESFAQNFVDRNDHLVSKKRKNALIETLRFICMTTIKIERNPLLKDNLVYEAYDLSLKHLFNGDIKEAVNVLNSAKAFKVSQLVLNAYSNTSVRKQFLENIQNKDNQGLNNIFEFLAGKQKKLNENNWMQSLLYYLLVKSNPSDSLQEIVKSYDFGVDNGFGPIKKEDQKIANIEIKGKDLVKEVPILWVLIKSYAYLFGDKHLQGPEQPIFNDLDYKLKTFSGIQFYPSGEKHCQDYRLSFLLTLCFSNLKSHVSKHIDDLYKNILFNKIFFDPKSQYQILTSYLNQLLRANDWQQALLVAQYIPITYRRERKQITFQIVQQKALTLLNGLRVDEELKRENFKFLAKKLCLPLVIMDMSRAIAHQYLGLKEYAMNDWMNAKNYPVAHRILINEIAPLFFSPSQLALGQISLTKIHALKGPLVDQLLKLETKNHDQITEGSVIQNFLRAITNYSSLKPVPEQIVKEYAEFVAKDLVNVKSSQSLGITIAKRFIWEFMSQWSLKNENLGLQNIRL